VTHTFADWIAEANGIPVNRFLDEMQHTLPWSNMEALLDAEMPNPGGGRPPTPFLLLFKMSLIQWWYGLGDLDTEFRCADSLSFRKFLGLGLTDAVPDGTTLGLFRQKMQSVNLQLKLHVLICDLLEQKGLLLKQGTLVDATFVKASKPKHDPDSKTGTKGKGYSVSVTVDNKTKIVRQIQVTDASVHDSQSLEAVLPAFVGNKVWVDLGYYGLNCLNIILATGAIRRMGYKKPKGKDLPDWQKGLNRLLAKTRARVEHVFASWKTRFNLTSSQYETLPKVTAYMHGITLASNLARIGFLFRHKSTMVWG
jgi:transposase, IS5 family